MLKNLHDVSPMKSQEKNLSLRVLLKLFGREKILHWLNDSGTSPLERNLGEKNFASHSTWQLAYENEL
jgi:hypothetical protein